jgi:g-D-glutamyl-meso-diaminopimelate peptidase
MELLRLGSTGANVELLQLALTRAGFNPGRIDGIFGPTTQNAVKRFQSANRLNPDGIVGPLTWNRLTPYLKGYTIHTVAPGDTFYSLARNYGTSVSAIQTANPEIDPQNIQIGERLVIPMGFALVPTNVSYSSALVEFIVEGLTARYPFLGSGTIGKSVMGKPIYYVEIGSGTRELSYNASHHANEWITTPVLLKFLEDYAAAYASGDSIYGMSARQLFQRASLYVVPLVNPDGVDLVTGALPESDSYYKKAQAMAANYPAIPFPSGWKANIDGIDTNLSYPAGWEIAREIKFGQGFTRPGPRDYVGPAPLAAVESKAMYDFTLAHNFALTLAYHTQGNVIFWKYLDFNPPNALEWGQIFSRVSGYPLQDTPYESGHAGYKDWFIQNYNLPGYTIEVGSGENPLPVNQFGQIYSDNIGILSLAPMLI